LELLTPLKLPNHDLAIVEACFGTRRPSLGGRRTRYWSYVPRPVSLDCGQRRGGGAMHATLLTPIYGWFKEGFDTADLKDAKTLLDELA
jgi:hypothetical protein